MDLKSSLGVVLFMLSISTCVIQVTSWPERGAYRSTRNGWENDASEGNDVQDADGGRASHNHHGYHHHHHHHRGSSVHLRMKHRNSTNSKVDDTYRDVARSTNADRGEDFRKESEAASSLRTDSGRKVLKSTSPSGSGSRASWKTKLRSHRGSRAWRRHGSSSGRIPLRPRPEEVDDDDYDYDGTGEGRHAYIMTPNERPEDKLEEDDIINLAFDRHNVRPPQHHESQATDRDADAEGIDANGKADGTGSVSAAKTEGDGESDDDELKHDVYAYQLPSDLWFIVRYARNKDGRVEKYMNIVDSFTNYLDKLEDGVRTVSVNVKGVETVFRLTPKHKPFHKNSASS